MDKILKLEFEHCLKYFRENTNYIEGTSGYGLTKDKYPQIEDIASIASTGYSLAALVLSSICGYISYEEGYKKSLLSLKSIYNLAHINGFYYHYLDYYSGKRALNSEVSIIDTSILLCGVLCVGDYFKGEVLELSNKIFERVKWQWFVDKKNNQFYLGYKNRFYGHWDNYAEQLIMYILSAGSPTYSINKEVYYSFKRNKKDDIIYSWFGSLFTYQYSHAWINFAGLKDELGVDWFLNSYKATLANKEYCRNLRNKTFKLGYWGLSATVTNKRYSQRLGAEPCVCKIIPDGTISISSLISSIIYDDIRPLINNLYYNYPNMFREYGFITSVNLSKRTPWYSNEYLGIDKGNTMLMLNNYFNRDIWNIMMNNHYVKCGLKRLNIKK